MNISAKGESKRDLLCDICGKSVYLTSGVTPPRIVMDYSNGKAYTVCGFCQYRLKLHATESGFLFHGIKNGQGYVDMGLIKDAIQGQTTMLESDSETT